MGYYKWDVPQNSEGKIIFFSNEKENERYETDNTYLTAWVVERHNKNWSWRKNDFINENIWAEISLIFTGHEESPW